MLMATCLTWAIVAGVGICDNAQPYLERLLARDAYRRAEAASTLPAVAPA